ncbi:MAG: hypothetical protein Q8M24_02345 [Pseudolabrys sp.]|nr:hypothetical protein [Pseudolabrys sp.]MDP2294285.1 hypothetical protein [Pseudolabrys sp.]
MNALKKTTSINNVARALCAAVLAAGLFASPLMMQGASAQSAAPAAATDAKPAAKAKKPPSPGQIALRDRQKKCGAEWKAAKAAGKVEKGMKWPKYWSACNKRLKSAT